MPNPFLLDLEFLRMTPENQFVGNTWNDHYDGINRANTAINRIPDIEMNENLRNRLIGEARFIRGLLYFNLVRFFGDVPLVTTDTRDLNDLNVSRSPSSEVYQQIIEDLEFASF
jgi:starch-binding outer membrane protein, SusD/RagB family